MDILLVRCALQETRHSKSNLTTKQINSDAMGKCAYFIFGASEFFSLALH